MKPKIDAELIRVIKDEMKLDRMETIVYRWRCKEVDLTKEIM